MRRAARLLTVLVAMVVAIGTPLSGGAGVLVAPAAPAGEEGVPDPEPVSPASSRRPARPAAATGPDGGPVPRWAFRSGPVPHRLTSVTPPDRIGRGPLGPHPRC